MGSFTYDSWSEKLDATIVNDKWELKKFPLLFCDTQDMGKSADEQEAIMSAAVTSKDKIWTDVLVFSSM